MRSVDDVIAFEGVVKDQFLRYSFTLDPSATRLLGNGALNRLDVTFGIDDVAEDGRFMACTGGWDWAPYSYGTPLLSLPTPPSSQPECQCACACACVRVCGHVCAFVRVRVFRGGREREGGREGGRESERL